MIIVALFSDTFSFDHIDKTSQNDSIIFDTNPYKGRTFNMSNQKMIYFEGSTVHVIDTKQKGWAVSLILDDKTQKKQK